MRVREKLKEFSATQWYKHGDHRKVNKLPEHELVGTVIVAGGLVEVVHPGDWILEDWDRVVRYCKADKFRQDYEVI